MKQSRCNRNYHRMKIFERETFGSGILSNYYVSNPPFTAPVIPKADFEKLVSDYNIALINYKNGGKAQKGYWLMAEHLLIEALDRIADNVDEVADGNEDIIFKGGFKPIKTYRSIHNIPPVPEIEKIDRDGEGIITVSCKSLGRDINYGCIISEGEPLNEKATMLYGKLIIKKGFQGTVIIDESQSRKKTFSNLTRAATYYIYFFAKNANGVSALSEPKSVICG